MLAPTRYNPTTVRTVGPVTASQPAGGSLGTWLSSLFGSNQPPQQPVQQVYQPNVYIPSTPAYVQNGMLVAPPVAPPPPPPPPPPPVLPPTPVAPASLNGVYAQYPQYQYPVQYPQQQYPVYQQPVQQSWWDKLFGNNSAPVQQYPQYPVQYPQQQYPQYPVVDNRSWWDKLWNNNPQPQYPVQYPQQYPVQYPQQQYPQYPVQYPQQYPQYPQQYPVGQYPQQYPGQYPYGPYGQPDPITAMIGGIAGIIQMFKGNDRHGRGRDC